MSWFVARTEPRREKVAKRFVETTGRTTYLPMYAEKRTSLIQPLFPNYLFIYNHDHLWRFLHGTVGIVCLIMRCGVPDEMPDKTMNELREMECDGLVNLESRGLRRGDKVDLIGCAFQGWRGVYDGMSASQRVRVLLEMLGAAVPVTVSINNIIRAA
jgi:transcription antitermination factor NusG